MEVETYRIACAHCKVLFWITKNHDDRLRVSKESFHCPNGHRQSYPGDTDAVKLERTERWLRNAKDRAGRTERSNSALRGVITKMRNKK